MALSGHLDGAKYDESIKLVDPSFDGEFGGL